MIRGFFDGDGSIYKKDIKSYSVYFSSNIFILKEIKKYLLKNGIKSGEIRLRNKKSINSGLLEISGSLQLESFQKLIYSSENTIFLKRKKEKFSDFNKLLKTLSNRKLSKEKINKIKILSKKIEKL